MSEQYIKNLVISLIKDDLVNNKLVSGLNNLGLSASDFHLGLSDTILTLMQLDCENDSIQDAYFNLTQQCSLLNLSDLANRALQLDNLANNIYNALLKYK
jgi:hypothetical protein